MKIIVQYIMKQTGTNYIANLHFGNRILFHFFQSEAFTPSCLKKHGYISD